MKNVIAIGPGMQPCQDGDIVIGDAAGSFLRITQTGEVLLNQKLIARDEKIHSSMRVAINCFVELPPWQLPKVEVEN